ncbi:hypothetical protein DS2_02363 [Catenovulum agarivorans DS-2]|uniref:Lcl C-terminal domain-containing protein n=1 Tax=Catenovulum agarivorans DS-2 TaxID=1328313 RepID=W7R2W9_9ALTE|nr:DUF1566 domain-containing protein [Catenovulum agarivorans]EWH11990.1 hypothetical protein DS2_02363 [Catenovulum agarivorans DS-2]
MKMIKSQLCLLQAALILMVSCLLSSCSGSLSSDSNDSDEQQVLSVDIGSDFEIAIGTEPFTINSVVKGDKGPFVYNWRTQPANFAEEALSATDTASVDFEIPEELNTRTDVLLSLTVNDAAGNAVSDQIIITLKPVNTLPIINLTVDDIDKVVDSGQGFNFTASWVDAEDGENVASARILVQQLSGIALENLPVDGILVNFPLSDDASPVGAAVADGQFVNASSQSASIRFTLEVTDKTGGVETQSVDVEILPNAESAPVVNAGNNQVVYVGQQVTLSASTASTANTQYNWQQVDGEQPIELSASQNPIVQFSAPDVTSSTVFEFQVVVTNTATNRRNSDFVRVTVLPISAFDGINDTGITTCADGTGNELNCGLTNYPRQDAERGRDPAQINTGLEKAGSGELGFDFTLLDADGEEIFAGTPSCIRDNVTGLIWEIKTTTGLRAHTHTFTWFDESDLNGAIEGTETSTAASCFLGSNMNNCNTQEYISAVNTSGMCGGHDWRLPTVNELVSILNYGQVEDKLALGGDNTQLWPNHAKTSTAYWTSLSAVFGVADSTSPEAMSAWVVNLATGDERAILKSNVAHILLVR